jgi:hypothetical protein
MIASISVSGRVSSCLVTAQSPEALRVLGEAPVEG